MRHSPPAAPSLSPISIARASRFSSLNVSRTASPTCAGSGWETCEVAWRKPFSWQSLSIVSEVTTAESGTPPKVFEPRSRNRTFSSFPASAAGTPMTRSRISPRAMSAISWIPSTGAYPARRILHGQVDRLRDDRPARRKGKADAPARAARPRRSQADA
jgi:hypothetical protein